MVDIFELADNIVHFEEEGLHGLAQLARYQNARERGAKNASSDTLEYFDKLAAAFLDAAWNETGDIHEVVKNPELGLTHRSKGRPKKTTIRLNDKSLRHKDYRMALHRAKLVESGIKSTEADELTSKEFSKGERAVRTANRAYREHVEYAMNVQRLKRRLAKNQGRKM